MPGPGAGRPGGAGPFGGPPAHGPMGALLPGDKAKIFRRTFRAFMQYARP